MNYIGFLREVVSSDGRGEREPYRPREIAVEEQVGVIFNSTASGAVFVNVVGIPGSSFCSGKSSAEEPPSEGFD